MMLFVKDSSVWCPWETCWREGGREGGYLESDNSPILMFQLGCGDDIIRLMTSFI